MTPDLFESIMLSFGVVAFGAALAFVLVGGFLSIREVFRER